MRKRAARAARSVQTRCSTQIQLTFGLRHNFFLHITNFENYLRSGQSCSKLSSFMYVHACRCGDHPEKAYQIENVFFAHPSVVSITSGMNSLFQRPSMQMSGRLVVLLPSGFLMPGISLMGSVKGVSPAALQTAWTTNSNLPLGARCLKAKSYAYPWFCRNSYSANAASSKGAVRFPEIVFNFFYLYWHITNFANYL